MKKVAVAVLTFALICPLGRPQTATQSATMHIYRNGSHGNAIQVLVDGAEVFKLDNHQMTTFTIAPGRHQVSARYAGQQPSVEINAEASHEYFIQLLMDVRHGVLGAAFGDPSMALAVTLTQEDSVLNAVQIHQRPLSHNEQDFIAYKISQAHPAVTANAAELATAQAVPSPAAFAAATVTPTATAPNDTSGQAYSVKYAGGSIRDGQVGKQLQLQIDNNAIQLGSQIIPSNSVTGITLSQDKHHRIGTGIALSMVTLGAGVPVMFSKSTKDFIEITWDNAGAKGGVAFQADKNEYRGILAALQGVTGKTATIPVEK